MMICDFSDYEELKRLFSVSERNNILLAFNSADDKDLENLKRVLNEYSQEQIYLAFSQQDQIKKVLKNINIKKKYILNNYGDLDCSSFFSSDDYKYIAEKFSNVFFVSTIPFTDGPYRNSYLKDNYRVIHSANHMYQKEKIIEDIIEEVKRKNLSPVEKYAYLYNIVKKYKKYLVQKEQISEGVDYLSARDSNLILFNEYMVCTGYANLLTELVNKLNDSNISVYTFDLKIKLAKNLKRYGHRRCLVLLKDDKYNIDNKFISDPTFDNDLENDFYNFFLTTNDEINDWVFEIYDSPTPTDVILGTSKFTKEEILHSDALDYSHPLMQSIFGKTIPYREYSNYIEQFNQKQLEIDTLREIIKNVYSTIYVCDEERLNDKVEKTMLENSERQHKIFDKYKNKFDLKSKTM